jgi:Spy/CpxP family protein refolding chaperone
VSVSDRSTTRTVVIATLALVVTFVAGFVTGVVTDRLLMHRGPHRPPPMMAHAMLRGLDHKLDLTDQQEEEIRKILERRHERMSATMRTELDQTNAEIERVLTPEQRVKFKELRLRLGPRMHHEGTRRREPTR